MVSEKTKFHKIKIQNYKNNTCIFIQLIVYEVACDVNWTVFISYEVACDVNWTVFKNFFELQVFDFVGFIRFDKIPNYFDSILDLGIPDKFGNLLFSSLFSSFSSSVSHVTLPLV